MTQKALIVGLTGNIATGKSSVLGQLAAKGAHVIDADQLTHRAMRPGEPAYQPIIDAFGPQIVLADGSINRSVLGQIVFGDPAALRQLEQIIHPAVLVLAQQEIAASAARVIVIEAIKLLEAQNLIKLCDEIWVVTASPATQLQRLLTQRGMSEAEARKRMAAQSPQEDKVKRAHRVINNDGSPETLQSQLDALWSEIEREDLA
jgi:dephospho-CoA kinase